MGIGLLNATVRIEFLECANCGTSFGVTENLVQRRREDGKDFWCPLGHVNVFRDNEVARLKRELEKANLKVQTAEKEALWQKQRRESAEKDAANAEKKRKATKTRLKNLQARVSKGYCPCCKKNFPEVYAHIVEEHPKYAADNPEVVSAGVKGLLPANGGKR